MNSPYPQPSLTSSFFDRQPMIAALIEVSGKSKTIDDAIQKVCNILSVKLEKLAFVHIRIIYENRAFQSATFVKTPVLVQKHFNIAGTKKCSIKVCFEIFDEDKKREVVREYEHFLKTILPLLKGIWSKFELETVLYHYGERKKELNGIFQTSEILKKKQPFENALHEICNILPASWQFAENTCCRITLENKIFESAGFSETRWKMEQPFELPDNKHGNIEIFYLKNFPLEFSGPFLKEEIELLKNIAALLTGAAIKKQFKKLHHENRERLKELWSINQTSRIIEEGRPIVETLQEICNILPHSWQYPDYTASRIKYEGIVYTSHGFEESEWRQEESFLTIDNKKGSIEIFYLREFPNEDNGPFLNEEQNLLVNIAKLISGYLNNFKGRGIIHQKGIPTTEIQPSEAFLTTMTKNKKPLQLYFNRQAIDKYIYLDMMKYKVKHILFVSTLYDAFTLESEDSFFARFMGEIYQYSLFSVPRITGVTTAAEALELLETTRFDLVILMAGMDREAPIIISEQIHEKYDSLPIYLLLNRKSDIKYYENLVSTTRSVDKLFVWGGDSLILFAIVKLTEDKVNVENDTKIGLVKIILLIEDSPLYYSSYIQILYDIVFNHVKQLLPEVEKNELDKISRMRSRPKILHARNYDEAIAIFNKYRDFMLCVISDVEFEKSGKMDKDAGVKLVRHIKSQLSKLPVILQSSENNIEQIANELDVAFINKNSESLLSDLKHYLNSYLGLGPFVFRDKKGNKIGVAKNLREFETLLMEVPAESLELHASENQLSLWLMSRGEIQLARTLHPLSLDMFESIEDSRNLLIKIIREYREEKKKGKILDFKETSVIDEKNIVMLSGGSLGGKGRGLAFINTLIYNIEFPELSKKINIISPITVAIGTNEFEVFIAKNNLSGLIIDRELPYHSLRSRFLKGKLQTNLLRKLKEFINQTQKPLIVRSSSNLEDSINQPFAGVFETYLVPNSANKRLVFDQVCNAIKLVYSSTFSPKAKNYFSLTNHKIEEEKMAVIIQEIVGNYHGDYYYPHISGTAQSFNYYPIASMKPEEGFAVAAFGLGTYVVDGWKSYRFSPKYPTISMYSIKDMLTSSQVKFYALDKRKTEVDFLTEGELASLELLDIETALGHDTLKHCVSVYNYNNDSLEPGTRTEGPIIVNFANILKYNYVPLAETIGTLLSTVQEAVGYPVEIEYAVDLNKASNGLPSFYILQIKPLLAEQFSKKINMDALDQSKIVLYSTNCVGNGIEDDICDFIYISNQRFDKLKTVEMAAEIEVLNKKMIAEGRKYILIGPGRWGSRDQFVGIPVNWSQISNAKIIVEISLPDFPLDSSLGSHFFHNVTAMNIGYFSVKHSSNSDFIKWDFLDSVPSQNETNFFRHIRLEEPVRVYMDGKNKTSAITEK